MQKLTKEQAAIIGLYTGIAAGPFADIHEYAEKLYGKPIFTHQFANEGFVQTLRDLAQKDFIAICFDE